jgi:hypothetical protein
MNSSDLQPGLSGSPVGGAESGRQFQSLQHTVVISLGALNLLALAVALFLYIQMKIVRAQVEDQRPAVVKLVTEYQKHSEPLVRNFTAALVAFAATNKDFQPLLTKYQPVLSSYLPAPTAKPAPAATQPLPASKPASK